MTGPPPCPRRTNANLHPAAPVIAAKQTRRSSEEVAKEKAALEAKRQLLLEKREAELEAIHKLELELEAQAQQNEENAARPPPAQSTPSAKKTGYVLARSAPLATMTAKPPSRAAGTDDNDSASQVGPAPTERKIQPGRSRRITRADVEAHGTHGVRIPAGQESVDEHAVKENVGGQLQAPAATTSSTVLGSSGGKKRKSDGGGETSSAKKGKPSKPSGPTAAAAAAFSTATPTAKKVGAKAEAASLPPPASTTFPTTSLLVPSITTATTTLPQGVFTQSTGASDLNDFEDGSSALIERPATLDVATDRLGTASVAKTKNIIQLEVVDVAAPPVGQHPQAAGAVVPALPPVQGNTSWALRDLDPILGPYAPLYTLNFVPQLINLTGNHASAPWSLHGLDLKGAIENLAAAIWPTLTIEVMPRQPFFDLAKQKLSEYRNGVANEAIIVVTAYMLSKRFDTSGDRAEYVAWALSPKDNWPFRFERVVEDEDGKVKTHGAYQGTLISRTFAYHLKRINLCGDQIRDHPCNALALTTTAVERALLMWSSGSLVRPCGRTEEAKFSERLWGKTANEYLGSIIDLTDEQWDSILAKADLCKRGLHVDSDDELEDEEHPEDLPTTGRAVLMDADLEEHERECFAPMALASDDAKAF